MFEIVSCNIQTPVMMALIVALTYVYIIILDTLLDAGEGHVHHSIIGDTDTAADTCFYKYQRVCSWIMRFSSCISLLT